MEADILKNSCNSTRFYSDAHECILTPVSLNKRLAGHIEVFEESQGKLFSAYLPQNIWHEERSNHGRKTRRSYSPKG